MRGTTIALLAASTLLLLNATRSDGQVVKVDYNPSKNRTAVTLDEVKLQSGVKFVAVYIVPGQLKAALPSLIHGIFTATSDDWRYRDCRELDFVVDGKPLRIANVSHDGRAGSGYVLEFLEFDQPVAVFTQLASARRVEGRLCKTGFAFDAKQLAAMRDFLSRMK
jgi:hypothetical protein